MVEYKVRYRLSGEIYESSVFATTSGNAIKWAQNAFPGATDVTVVSMQAVAPYRE